VQSKNTYLSLNKPIEINLATEHSEISEDELTVKNIFLHVAEKSGEKQLKRKAAVEAAKTPKLRSAKKDVLASPGVKSPTHTATVSRLNSI